MPLLKQYLLLCCFTKNPADLHPSRSFLWKCVAFYLISGIIVEAIITDAVEATLEVSMRAVIALSLIASLSFATRQWSMFIQLLIAIFVCENFIVTLGIGTEILDVFLSGSPFEDVPSYLGVALIVWYLGIISYILRQVFSFKTGRSVALAFGYFALSYGGPFLLMEVL
jgi:hypothetical protein